MKTLACSDYLPVSCLAAQVIATPVPVASVRKDSDGITLPMNPGVLRLEVYSPRIIRVTYTAPRFTCNSAIRPSAPCRFWFRAGVTQLITVRCGWANVPEGNLFNRTGLPASPFRTDVD